MRSQVFSPKMEGTAQMELSLLFGDRFNYFLLNTVPVHRVQGAVVRGQTAT